MAPSSSAKADDPVLAAMMIDLGDGGYWMARLRGP
jgi:hypothetical protein